MKKKPICLLLGSLVFALSACGGPAAMGEAAVAAGPSTAEAPFSLPQTGYTKPVPDGCLTPAERPGTVVPLTYDTLDYPRDAA